MPGEEALAVQEADSGVARLRAGDPFPEEMSALWLGVQSLGFTLVCEPHENLLLAEGTLRTLSRHCLEHLHMLGQGSEVSRLWLNTERVSSGLYMIKRPPSRHSVCLLCFALNELFAVFTERIDLSQTCWGNLPPAVSLL